MKRTLLMMLISGVLFGLTACATQPPKPVPSASPLQSQSPQATPIKPILAFPTPILPTPASKDTGTVGGVILRETPGQPLQALTSGRLILGKVYRDADGRPMMAGPNMTKPLGADAKENGQFVFEEVPIGSYALMFDNPALGTILLKDPKTGNDLLIDVKGGDVINLGELRYDITY